jgi:hypothetical protein
MSLPSILLIATVFFIPTAWAIVHIAQRDFGSIKKKAFWGLVVVFLPPIGGIVYLASYKLRKTAGPG